MIFFRKSKAEREALERTIASLDETFAAIEAQQPRVNAVQSWIDARKLSGDELGEDIEFTLIPRPWRAAR